ncbi:HTTM domain-containing protein [Streptomyces albipurpureus]|uniref:HTTM domain-containing protein n=1 Tax=Streptomyces albipurpureus TaxID=2897419 RepID=A0ABT0UK46_9ACTN|nr:HTTM domain-containing protein [Streptomyces sp. CWNU-1]MCM2388878.1 HTTM domain-containing protein [Streptomyces sp. CWNU-1]
MNGTPGGRIAAAVQKVSSTALGPYQSAVVRIGFAATWLLFLLRELPNRHEMYGPEGPWSWDMGRQLLSVNDAFTVLMWSDTRLWFEFVYGASVLASALFLLGWRTRTMSVLFMVGVLSLQNRSIFIGDGGDNAIHLIAIYLVFTRCGQVWSLDARQTAARQKAARQTAEQQATEQRTAEQQADRAAKAPLGASTSSSAGPLLWSVLGFLLLIGSMLNQTGWHVLLLLWAIWAAQAMWWLVGRYGRNGEPRILLDAIANLLHNAALLVVMAEVCLIYATAGWYKIQGSRWQDGTALYYPLKLDYFTPWPALSDLLASGGVMVMVLTYGTVIVQVAFPFTLFNRRVKNVLLAVMMLEHAAIAVLLGLPFFSLAMIAADAVFLPTAFLVWLGARAAHGRYRLSSRFGKRPPQQQKEPQEHPPTLVG